ncbi:MAG: zinc-finger domain-containing protein [Rhodospirillales bacterium]|nr:zinc-finger domain-containing protein [Alphaproteobacteria bacterium]MCB9986893.1 zinc-finger domain-containing protein [Rhodospirillales bacterium]USO08329.1 MAG: zinc-finger domain-containing protein [Rhodospirillales bacterium]
MTAAPKTAPTHIQVPKGADEVACDGGNGALGHPRVYYSFDSADTVTCGYCDRVFSKK